MLTLFHPKLALIGPDVSLRSRFKFGLTGVQDSQLSGLIGAELAVVAETS